MSETREVIRCTYCRLNQFMTIRFRCRRCYAPLPVRFPERKKVEEVPREEKPKLTFSEKIFLVRTMLGITGKQLTGRAGISRSALSKIENGHAAISIYGIEKVCEGLGVEPPVFFNNQFVEMLDPFSFELLKAYRRLAPKQIRQIVEAMDGIAKGKDN